MNGGVLGLNILVAGGAGFIGSNLVDTLLERGYAVKVLDDFSSGKPENLAGHAGAKNFELIRGSILDMAKIVGAIKGIDAVVNLAAKGNLAKSVEDPLSYHDVNTTGTLNLLHACVKHEVKKFVFTSSGSVYKSEITGPISEDAPYGPESPYAATKVCAEIYAKTFRRVYGLNTVILRLFNVYGPRREKSSYSGAVTNFILKVMRGEEVEVFGDGCDVRDYVYVGDVVKAIILSLEKDVSGEYNVGTGIGTTTNSLVDLVGKVVGVKPNIVHRPKRQGDTPSRIANIAKSSVELGYYPEYDLYTGLVRLKNYLLANAVI
ncbi:MAG: NAD-dependent epimerase/dehydratase family protein [Thermoprotei archaeon]